MSGPIPHGPSTRETLLDDAVRVISTMTKRDKDELRFSMMALVTQQ